MVCACYSILRQALLPLLSRSSPRREGEERGLVSRTAASDIEPNREQNEVECLVTECLKIAE